MNKPYQDTNTGIWNGVQDATEVERIPATVYDNDGNHFPALIEIEITGDEILVTNVSHGANVPLNNPTDDITDAIKGRYKYATITYQTL